MSFAAQACENTIFFAQYAVVGVAALALSPVCSVISIIATVTFASIAIIQSGLFLRGSAVNYKSTWKSAGLCLLTTIPVIGQIAMAFIFIAESKKTKKVYFPNTEKAFWRNHKVVWSNVPFSLYYIALLTIGSSIGLQKPEDIPGVFIG